MLIVKRYFFRTHKANGVILKPIRCWLVTYLFLMHVNSLIHREREREYLPILLFELALGFHVLLCLNAFLYGICTIHINNLHDEGQICGFQCSFHNLQKPSYIVDHIYVQPY